MKLFWSYAALFLVLITGTASAAPSAGFSGLLITTITLTDDHGAPWPGSERLMPLVMTKPGTPLSSNEVRKSIEYLYLKGLFKDIRVEAFPDGNGVRLAYTLAPVTAVEKLVVSGNHEFSDSQLKEAMRGVEGKELHEENFPDLRTNIQALYQAEGFYNAKVNFRVIESKKPHRVVLHIDIFEGEPTVIEAIHFKGNSVFTEKQLLAVMESEKGDPLRTPLLFDTDMEAILKKYTDAGYPAAKPGPVSMSFRNNKAYLEILGEEGPRVTVRFSGNSEFSSKKLKQMLLLWSEHDISDTIIDSSADKIKNAYLESGYADVKVDVKKTVSNGNIVLEFLVQEGPNVSLRQIVIEGGVAFPEKEIISQMFLRESGWFRSRPLREDLLEKDIDNIKDRYAEAGYLDAGMEKKAIRSDDGKTATVYIKITEGPKTVVGRVSFEGNALFSEEELLDKLNLKAGLPFNERVMEEDRYRILSAYSAKGYLYAKVEVDREPLQKEHNAGQAGDASAPAVTGPVEERSQVHYRITEDKPVTVGTVILRGNELTKDHVIMRELLAKPGDPYDYSAILTTQQRLYRLGYFGQVRFEPMRPGEKEYTKDMLLTIEERNAGLIETGFGYGDLDRFRVFVEPSYRNLFGGARSVSLRLEESDILKQAVFNFREPWFMGHRIESKFSLLWSDTKKLNSDTRDIYFQTRKSAASYGLEKSYDGLKLSLTYQFENIENYNVKQAAMLTQEDKGRVLVSSLGPGLIYDKRDDVFNPKKGSLHGLNLKEAMKELGSEADFTKITGQTAWYLPLGGDTIAALSARAGLAKPHRDTAEVPIHERFYLGGGTTVRGYTQDGVGPYSLDSAGNRIPTGGSRMVLFNAEVRFNPTEGFGIVFFTDAGKVWLDRIQDPVIDPHPHGLRASFGTGLRYGTPVGPLRIDYGQKIHRLSGESPGELHFSIGHAF